MFSLIVVLLSIALVAALALATMYYGGSNFTQGTSRAQSARLQTQGQQILAAMDMFHLAHGRWPTQTELTTPDAAGVTYLRSMPVARADAPAGSSTPVAWADGQSWQVVDGTPTAYISSSIDRATCQAYNKSARGDDGILSAAVTGLLSQCYGADAASLTVLVSRALATSQSSAQAVGLDVRTADGASSSAAPWLVEPTPAAAAPAPSAPVTPVPAVGPGVPEWPSFLGYSYMTDGGTCDFNGPTSRWLRNGRFNNVGTGPLTITSVTGAQLTGVRVHPGLATMPHLSFPYVIPAGSGVNLFFENDCTGGNSNGYPTAITVVTDGGTFSMN